MGFISCLRIWGCCLELFLLGAHLRCRSPQGKPQLLYVSIRVHWRLDDEATSSLVQASNRSRSSGLRLRKLWNCFLSCEAQRYSMIASGVLSLTSPMYHPKQKVRVCCPPVICLVLLSAERHIWHLHFAFFYCGRPWKAGKLTSKSWCLSHPCNKNKVSHLGCERGTHRYAVKHVGSISKTPSPWNCMELFHSYYVWRTQ